MPDNEQPETTEAKKLEEKSAEAELERHYSEENKEKILKRIRENETK